MKNMRRIVCIIMILVVSASMVVPAAADSKADFVPSITYKQGIVIKEAILEGIDVSSCIVVTNIKQAREKTTDITHEARDLLLECYEKLESGEMKLPVEEGYVVRELVDISFMEKNCVQIGDHGDKPEKLEKEEVTIDMVLELGVAPKAEIVILAYIDEEWVEAVEVVNNGDGTIDVSFEDLCPVAICVK